KQDWRCRCAALPAHKQNPRQCQDDDEQEAKIGSDDLDINSAIRRSHGKRTQERIAPCVGLEANHGCQPAHARSGANQGSQNGYNGLPKWLQSCQPQYPYSSRKPTSVAIEPKTMLAILCLKDAPGIPHSNGIRTASGPLLSLKATAAPAQKPDSKTRRRRGSLAGRCALKGSTASATAHTNGIAAIKSFDVES